MEIKPDSYWQRTVNVSFNSRYIIIPFFRVGVAEVDLVGSWEMFRDFKMGVR